jgi:3-deoxy-D-manno-octulosonic-acid transferase
METEIWPNLFASCEEHKVPLCIINARLSEKSARGYRKIPDLIRPALAEVRLIAAQTDEDARRFLDIGAAEESVKTLGNMKFDIDISEETLAAGFKLKEHWFKGRFVWLLASTHKDEEAVFFPIYKQLKQRIPELLMVIVPRHPERFPEVGKLCEQNRLHAVARTSRMACGAATDVYLADTMGELKMFYAAADIAFVGGSMVPVGGHNILEAAAVGVPVMFGPYMANFREIADKVLERGAAVQCRNEQDIAEAVLKLYTRPDYRGALVAKSKQFLNDNRGAIDKICDRLYQSLKS